MRICKEFVLQFHCYMSDLFNVNFIVDFFSSIRQISYLFLKLIQGNIDPDNCL